MYAYEIGLVTTDLAGIDSGMAIFRGCSTLVIRCFKRVEYFADWLTGAAGPVFVFLCWTLIIGGGIAFFDVISRDLNLLPVILLSPVFILTPLNLYGQYYLVTKVPPGFPSPRALALSPNGPVSTAREMKWLVPKPNSLWRAETWGLDRRGGERSRTLTGERENQSGTAGLGLGGLGEGKRVRRCRKCDGPKPERTHHCSVCKRCILLMDHHCPWINGCVGLHNQRHFVLFMVYLSIGCWNVAALGYSRFWSSLEYKSDWPAYTPRIGFTLIYILCVAIGIAVPVLASWHIFMVSNGETSIESHDNSYLDGKAKSEGLIYLNPYDLGRRRNLELFFNVGAGGYPLSTLLFPFLIPPASNGWTYPRRSLPPEPHLEPTLNLHAPELADGLVASPPEQNGAENGHAGWSGESRYIMGDEEGGLTDDEEGGGGWMD